MQDDKPSNSNRLLAMIREKPSEAILEWVESTGFSKHEALALASEAGVKSAVVMLLTEGADPNASMPPSLVRAVEERNYEIFEALYEAGAGVGASPWWEDGDHPLVSAASIGDPKAIGWLCSKPTLSISDERWIWDSVEILNAAEGVDSEIGLAILLREMVPYLRVGEISPSPGQLAKSLEKLKKLQRSERAVGLGLIETVSAIDRLIEEAADDFDLFYELTRSRDYDKCLEYLSAVDGEARRQRSGYALLWALSQKVWRKLEGVEPDEAGVMYLDRIFSFDPDPNLGDEGGVTAIMYAAYRGRLDLVKRIYEIGGDLSLRDSEGEKSALDWARRSCDEETIGWIEEAVGR